MHPDWDGLFWRFRAAANIVEAAGEFACWIAGWAAAKRAPMPKDKVGLGSIRRPVIGLALGGGAARGFAHIGIVRTLVAHGIVPNVVVGTSIGAVVGGAYASGHLDALEAWARSLQPRSVLSYLDIRLNGSGLIGGAKLAAEIEAAMGQNLIEDLPVKFATVATEVRTGHEIWLTHGPMVDAMRASYALPGIFSPVMVGDRWLVDGALVNPVPVSAARALGAEIVIAANLSSDVFTHSTTIYSHGPTAGVSVSVMPEAEPEPRKRGIGKFFSAERTMKREFFGGGDGRASPRSWSMPSTSCRTASPARGWPAIRLIC